MSIVSAKSPITGSKIQFALVGCDRTSHKHLDALGMHEERAALIAICDADAEDLASIQARTGATTPRQLDPVPKRLIQNGHFERIYMAHMNAHWNVRGSTTDHRLRCGHRRTGLRCYGEMVAKNVPTYALIAEMNARHRECMYRTRFQIQGNENRCEARGRLCISEPQM